MASKRAKKKARNKAEEKARQASGAGASPACGVSTSVCPAVIGNFVVLRAYQFASTARAAASSTKRLALPDSRREPSISEA